MTHPRRVIVDSVVAQQLITLDQTEAHYIKNVLRLSTGAAVTIVSKSTQLNFKGFVASVSPNVQIQVLDRSSAEFKSSIVSTLFLPLLKGDHIELAIEKCTELGVSHFNIYEAERSIVKLKEDSESRKNRLERIAMAAARQSGRSQIPAISLYPSLSIAIAQRDPANSLIYCSLEESAIPISALAPFINSIDLVIGPEGDLTPLEIELLKSKKANALSLGKLLLRSETAAIAAVAMLHAHSANAL